MNGWQNGVNDGHSQDKYHDDPCDEASNNDTLYIRIDGKIKHPPNSSIFQYF